MSTRKAFLIGAFFASTVSWAHAQMVRVGLGGEYNAGSIPVTGVTTLVAVNPANLDGELTTAVFGWFSSPCPATAKIKIFRPTVVPFRWNPLPAAFEFVAERGPFDVTAPLDSSEWPFYPVAVQTVTLEPPLPVRAGDVIAITNLTSCGAPTAKVDPPLGNVPHGPGFTFAVPGDVTSTVTRPPLGGGKVFLSATGPSSALGLEDSSSSCLFGDGETFCGLSRFAVTLEARNPRTGEMAVGVPIRLSFRSGYFSLPAFTGDPQFPEVTVKIVDATLSLALGGHFWFFHSPLTDVSYTITVKDQWRNTERTYSNQPGAPGQLCGEADTNAFPP